MISKTIKKALAQCLVLTVLISLCTVLVCMTAESKPDKRAPVVSSTEPANGAIDVPVYQDIAIKFNESVTRSIYFDNITLNDQPIGGRIYEDTLYFWRINLNNSTNYTVKVPAGAVQDLAGNKLAKDYSFSFTTMAPDTVPPAVSATDPADGASEVALGKTISVGFDEAVYQGANFYNITLKAGETAVDVDTAVSDRTITVDPAGDLDYNTTYTVTIPAGAVEDLAGNVLAGDYSFSFTSGQDIYPPAVKSTNPLDGTTSESLRKIITIQYDEAVQAGDTFGNITLKDANGDGVSITSVISGDTMTVTPSAKLAGSTTYILTVPAGVIEDVAGNETSDRLTLSFTTGVYDWIELPAGVTDTLVDPDRPIIYLTCSNEKKIYAVNYLSGESSSLSFDYTPESLEIGSGDYAGDLYVALLHQAHSSYWWKEDQTGTIAVIDRDAFAVKDMIDITVDPFDIVAGRDGCLYIPSGSGQHTNFDSYSLFSKQLSDRTAIRQMSYAKLHPAIERIYTVNTDVSPRDLRAYNIAGGAFTDPKYPGGYDSPYHGDYPLEKNLALEPTGRYLFNGSGCIFTTAAEKSQDMLYVTRLDTGYVDIAFESDLSQFYTISGSSIIIYRGSDFNRLNTISLINTGNRLFKKGDQLFAITGHPLAQNGNALQIVDIPAGDPDIYPPAIKNTNPVDGATNEAMRKIITIQHDEAVQAGFNFGNITLKDAGGAGVPITSNISGNTLTITPTVKLDANTTYNVTVPAGAVKDMAGNLITNNYIISFTTGVYDWIELPFTVSDAVVDPDKPVVYLTCQDEKKIYAVNYISGESSSISFDYAPESLELGRGEYEGDLYVALLHQAHSYYWWDEDQTGTVAVIDRDTFTVKDKIEIAVDPFDIVAGSDGYLYIPSGSGQWTNFDSYNLLSKQLNDRTGIRNMSYAKLHPIMERIYTVNTDVSPRDLRAYNIAGGAFTDPIYPGGYDSPYHGDYPLEKNLALEPTGRYLFNGSGCIFTTAEEKSQDMLYVAKLDSGYYAIAFEPDFSQFYTISGDDINIYRGSDFSRLDTIPLASTGRFLFEKDNQLVAVISNPASQNGSALQVVDIPVDNRPTVVATEPLSGAVDVTVDKGISITFNEDITAGSEYNFVTLMDSHDSPVTITKNINGSMLSIDHPALGYSTTYTVTVPAGAVRDLTGNALAGDYSFSFTTVAAPDTAPPTVSATDPANGEINIPFNKTIAVNFSEAVQLGPNANGILLKKGNTKAAYTLTIQSGTLNIDPVSNLSKNSTYTVTIPAGAIQDMSGNVLASTYTFSFTTSKK